MIYTPNTGVRIQERWLHNNAFKDYVSPSDNPQEWGLPQFNPLLQKEIQLSPEALSIGENLGLHPYLTPCIQVNMNGGLLDPEWQNCFGHNVLAAKFNMTDAALIGSKQLQILQAGATGLLHDSQQRIAKEQMQNLGTYQNGQYTTRKVSPEELFAAEWNEDPVNGVPGLESFDPWVLLPTRVTHLDWRGYFLRKWSREDSMARLMDSSIAATRNEDGAYGVDTIVDPFERINMLKKHKPELHEEGLKPEYYGRRTFDVLEDITASIIPYLSSIVEKRNPNFLAKHPKGDFISVIRDIVQGEIPFPVETLDYKFM